MSKLGETTDKILELLYEKETVPLKELEKKLPQLNSKILNFMNQGGLIEMKNGDVNITEFGYQLITAE